MGRSWVSRVLLGGFHRVLPQQAPCEAQVRPPLPERRLHLGQLLHQILLGRPFESARTTRPDANAHQKGPRKKSIANSCHQIRHAVTTKRAQLEDSKIHPLDSISARPVPHAASPRPVPRGTARPRGSGPWPRGMGCLGPLLSRAALSAVQPCWFLAKAD